MSDQDDAYKGDDEAAAVVVEDKAFIEAPEHTLNGLTLHPYSPERMWAADAIGLRYGRLTPEQVEQFGEDGTYPGMAGDVPVVIWVCSLEKRGDVLSARRNPTLAMDKVIQFAEIHKIVSPKQSQWWDAYKVFLQIMGEVQTSYGESEGQKKTEQVEQATAT